MAVVSAHIRTFFLVGTVSPGTPPLLQTLLPAQQLLEDGPKAEAMLRYLPEEGLIETVKKKWATGMGWDAKYLVGCRLKSAVIVLAAPHGM